jgi:integrase/recombinase XerD
MHPRKDPARRCLKPALWPEADRRAWEAAQRQGDVLEPGGGAAGWAPHTRTKIEKGYGRWLTWLISKDLIDPLASPADRVTPEWVAQYVAELRKLNAPYSVLARVQELYQVMVVMVPEQDWTWIRRIETRVRHTVIPSRNKRGRVVSVEKLYAFGLELMANAEGPRGGTALERAVRYRDGLMVCLLAARPLRRRNFAAIELNRHLTKQGDFYFLRFEAAETKTHQPIEVPFPIDLVPSLERHLSHYRPFLLARTGRWSKVSDAAANALWVSKDGSAMTEIAIYFRIMKLTRAKFGHVVNLHLFRDCAATSTAIQDPEHAHINKSILGHATLRTSERHYNHARTLEAMRRHQAQILRLRRLLKAAPKATQDKIANPTGVGTCARLGRLDRKE